MEGKSILSFKTLNLTICILLMIAVTAKGEIESAKLNVSGILNVVYTESNVPLRIGFENIDLEKSTF